MEPNIQSIIRQQLLDKEEITHRVKLIISEYLNSFDAVDRLNSKETSLVKLLPYRISRNIHEFFINEK